MAKTARKSAEWWPEAAACLLLWAAVAATLAIALKKTGGVFTYPLDDTYIHMAVARNLVEHGTWNVGQSGFVPVSSSILWPPLIALSFMPAGPFDSAPLFLALLFATWFAVAAGNSLRKIGLTPHARFGALVSIVLLVPLPLLVIEGMEHSLQLLVCFLLVERAAGMFDGSRTELKDEVWTSLLAALGVATRYEVLFLVAPICLLLVLRRKYVASLAVAAAASLPVAIFGLVSVAHGSYFLPNPVLLKGWLKIAAHFGRDNLGWALLSRVLEPSKLHLLLLMLAAVFLGRVVSRPGVDDRRAGTVLLVVGAGMLCQLLFGSTGWLYRYEAYLVGMVLVGIFDALVVMGSMPSPFGDLRSRTAAFLVALAFVALLPRWWASTTSGPLAVKNVFEQQLQLARFLGSFYGGKAVAINDIGAVSYYSGVEVVDLWGIGDTSVLEEKLQGAYSADTIRRIAADRGVVIAAVYADWYLRYGGLPREWKPVGSWTIRDNVICGGDTVTFYAVAEGAELELRRNLLEFIERLPGGVHVELHERK